MTSVDEIEQLIKPLLLTTVVFSIDGKVIKQGRLQLFSIKDFFCVFTLLNTERDGKKAIYELPYPFNVTVDNTGLQFDYTMDAFCLSNQKIKEQIGKIKIGKAAKFFNKRVLVTSVY